MKKIIFVLSIICGVSFAAQAQTVKSPQSLAGSSEMLPSYPGGTEALQKFVTQNLSVAQIGERKTGAVTVYFMVDAAGNASDFQVLKGIDERYDALALEAVKKVQRWTPGRFGNTPRSMGHKVEITF